MRAVLLVSTYPDRQELRRIAHKLVTERLAACVNITSVSSVYSWNGKIVDSREYMAFFKTTLRNKRQLWQKILETHPYEVPEIAELGLGMVNPPYLRWIAESTKPGTSARRSPRRAR